MLQTIEAIIETDGTVRLLKPWYPPQPVRAIVTLLEPITPPIAGQVSQVLALLKSAEFQLAPSGNPVIMEATIQANRHAWD